MGAHRSAAMERALELIRVHKHSASEAAIQVGITVQAIFRDPEYREWKGLPPHITTYQRKKKKAEDPP